MWLYIILGIFIILIISFIFMYNSFVSLNNKAKEAFSTMDVYLKKRWDLIPNIVESVKGYAKHENNTLKEVIGLRSGNYDSLDSNDKIAKNAEISKSISKLMLLVEKYPDLKANENFNNLTNELHNIESEIAESRKYYNAVVRMFNDKCEMFPGNIFSKIFGFKSKAMFETAEEERKNVKVKF